MGLGWAADAVKDEVQRLRAKQDDIARAAAAASTQALLAQAEARALHDREWAARQATQEARRKVTEASQEEMDVLRAAEEGNRFRGQ